MGVVWGRGGKWGCSEVNVGDNAPRFRGQRKPPTKGPAECSQVSSLKQRQTMTGCFLPAPSLQSSFYNSHTMCIQNSEPHWRPFLFIMLSFCPAKLVSMFISKCSLLKAFPPYPFHSIIRLPTYYQLSFLLSIKLIYYLHMYLPIIYLFFYQIFTNLLISLYQLSCYLSYYYLSNLLSIYHPSIMNLSSTNQDTYVYYLFILTISHPPTHPASLASLLYVLYAIVSGSYHIRFLFGVHFYLV